MRFYLLGTQPDLSLAELAAVHGPSFQPVLHHQQILLAESNNMPAPLLQKRLGGTIKIGQIIAELPSWDHESARDLIAGFAQGAAGKEKISFGISAYAAGGSGYQEIKSGLHRLGIAVKKLLKETGRPVRYVQSKESSLSSVIVRTNGLLESGGEYVLIAAKDKIYIGQTETVQDFKAWGTRDYGRPGRDAKSGMLPPKLARMMINLGGTDPEGTSLLDPFCGSGTVLNEALLMGCSTLIGNDISEQAIEDTGKNLTWLISERGLQPPKLFLHTGPAAELPEAQNILADLLVTEVYLGKPRRRALDPYEGKVAERELMPMYRDSFEALRSLLKPDGVAVVAFPAFKLRTKEWHRMAVPNLLEQLGYEIYSTHWYARHDQFVARDLYVFGHKKA